MTENERIRYFRQLILPGFGDPEQKKLKDSTALIVGAGGLGSPAAFYLAAAGIGRLIICDRDSVELSNLNRQILHGTNDIGSPKTDSAGKTLLDLNPEIQIETHHIAVDQESLGSKIPRPDVVADCLDNLNTRMVLNNYSLETGIPIVHAGIDNWSGQVTFLNPPSTPCMNCLFGESRDTSDPKPVLGAVVGIIGTTLALEIIRYLSGIGSTLKNKLLYFNGLAMEWNKLELNRDEDCMACSSYH